MSPYPTLRWIVPSLVLCASVGGISGQGAVVLLTTGGVLEGTVSLQGDRCVVASDAVGETTVPTVAVALIAADLSECYRRLDSRVASGDAEARVRLAWWCLDNGLVAEAQRELAQATTIDGDLGDLPKLRAAVAAKTDTAATVLPTTLIAGEPPAARGPAAPATAPEGRADLTVFRRDAEPVLLKNCSTSRCHGSRTRDGFRLLGVPDLARGPTRLQSQANLRATAAWLDDEAPDQSRLLTEALRPHAPGVSDRPLAPNDDEFAVLRSWVFRSVGHSVAPPPPKRPAPEAPAEFADEFALLDAAWSESGGEEADVVSQVGGSVREPRMNRPNRFDDELDPAIYNQRRFPDR